MGLAASETLTDGDASPLPTLSPAAATVAETLGVAAPNATRKPAAAVVADTLNADAPSATRRPAAAVVADTLNADAASLSVAVSQKALSSEVGKLSRLPPYQESSCSSVGSVKSAILVAQLGRRNRYGTVGNLEHIS